MTTTCFTYNKTLDLVKGIFSHFSPFTSSWCDIFQVFEERVQYWSRKLPQIEPYTKCGSASCQPLCWQIIWQSSIDGNGNQQFQKKTLSLAPKCQYLWRRIWPLGVPSNPRSPWWHFDRFKRASYPDWITSNSRTMWWYTLNGAECVTFKRPGWNW